TAAAIAPRVSFARLAQLDKPPAVLADRAEQILSTLGYNEPRGDTADGYLLVADYIDWISRTDSSAHRWDRIGRTGPPAMLFWYRTSPRTLVPRQLALRVTPNDPAPNDTGMHMVAVDMHGRLLQFNSVPPQYDADPNAGRAAPPWPQLFEAAGLPMAAFQPV